MATAKTATTGRRKTAVARIQIAAGTGKIRVNGKNFDEYFTTVSMQNTVLKPLEILKLDIDFPPENFLSDTVGAAPNCEALIIPPRVPCRTVVGNVIARPKPPHFHLALHNGERPISHQTIM